MNIKIFNLVSSSKSANNSILFSFKPLRIPLFIASNNFFILLNSFWFIFILSIILTFVIGVLIGGVIYANYSVLLFYICSSMLAVAAIITIFIYIIKRKDSKI